MTIANLLQKKDKGLISNVAKQQIFSTNRQTYKPYYIPSGDFFIAKIDHFKKINLFMEKMFGFKTKNKFSVDINYQKDLDYLIFF